MEKEEIAIVPAELESAGLADVGQSPDAGTVETSENVDLIYELQESSETSTSEESERSEESDSPEKSERAEKTEKPSAAEAELQKMIEEVGPETLLDIIRDNRNAAIRQIISEVEATQNRALQSGSSAAKGCTSIFDLAALA